MCGSGSALRRCLTVLLSLAFLCGMLPLPVGAQEDLVWREREPMYYWRFFHGVATAPDGKIYAIGGHDGADFLDSVEVYDPVADLWEERSSMPTPRATHATVTASNGRIYAIGGGICFDDQCFDLSTVEEYDPTTDTWSLRTDMPTPRGNLGLAAATNGKVYAIGGCPGDPCVPSAVVEEYDPATDTWARKADMPTARGAMGVVAASNGKIYVIGGCADVGCQIALDTVEEYDPATDTWTTRASLPTARTAVGAAATPDGRIYVIAGHDGSSFVDTVEEYDVATDTWTTRASVLIARSFPGVAFSGGKIYVIGGADDTDVYDVVEEATLPAIAPPATAEPSPAEPVATESIDDSVERLRRLVAQPPAAGASPAATESIPTPRPTVAESAVTGGEEADSSGIVILLILLGVVAVGGAVVGGVVVAARSRGRSGGTTAAPSALASAGAPAPPVAHQAPPGPPSQPLAQPAIGSSPPSPVEVSPTPAPGPIAQAPVTPSPQQAHVPATPPPTPGANVPTPAPPAGSTPIPTPPPWQTPASPSSATVPAWNPGVIDSGAERIAYEFQIVGEPMHGGMASVCKAYQPKLDRHVALKTMSPMLAGDPSFVQRFYEEARRTAKLDHPNIVTIHDVGQLPNGQLFITMRYVDGMTLQQLLARERVLSCERAIRIAIQVADALDYAHRRGIIHRDVKPSNIMIEEPDDRVTLTDFGIAKAVGETQFTRTGAVVGTPKYLSPEQALGHQADHRADIYALGIVLYEMIVGRAPFEAEMPLAMLNAHISQPPPRPRDLNPQIPAAVEAVVLKALEKDREQRFATARDFIQALRQALADGTQVT